MSRAITTQNLEKDTCITTNYTNRGQVWRQKTGAQNHLKIETFQNYQDKNLAPKLNPKSKVFKISKIH